MIGSGGLQAHARDVGFTQGLERAQMPRSRVVEFPRLECYLSMRNDGRLVLNNGMPGKSEGLLWKAMMHNDHAEHHYATLENGQLVIYRGAPGNPEAIPYKTPAVSEPGTYKLGITTSKRLVIFREEKGNNRKIVWRSQLLEKWRL